MLYFLIPRSDPVIFIINFTLSVKSNKTFTIDLFTIHFYMVFCSWLELYSIKISDSKIVSQINSWERNGLITDKFKEEEWVCF